MCNDKGRKKANSALACLYFFFPAEATQLREDLTVSLEPDEEEDEQEAVTYEDIAAAVSKAVEASGGDDEDEDEDDAAPTTAPEPAEEEKGEEEEEEEAPKKKKVKLAGLTLAEKYDHFAAMATAPGKVSQLSFRSVAGRLKLLCMSNNYCFCYRMTTMTKMTLMIITSKLALGIID
jgi:hypothetical protein